MSIAPFDLISNEFILCTANIQIKDSSMLIGISIIDSYNKSIKLTQMLDTSFFTSLESLLKQIIPPHEDTNYFFLGNCPNNTINNQINYIIKSIGCINDYRVETNDKIFQEKIIDCWSGIKILFDETQFITYTVAFNSIEYILPLETLYHTLSYSKILQNIEFQNYFNLEKFNNKEFMSFDVSCIKCLNLFDSLEERKNFLSTSTLQKLAKNTFSGNNNGSNKTSVFQILNNCCTKFGARTLRTWLIQPLQEKKLIEERLNLVEALVSRSAFNMNLRNDYLSKIDDIQTINMKIAKFTNRKKEKNSTTYLKLVDCAKLQRCIGICTELFAFLKMFDGENKEIFYNKYVVDFQKILQFLAKLEELISKTIVYDYETRDYTINPEIDEELKKIKMKINQNYNQILKIKEDIEYEINSNVKKPKKVGLEEYVNAGYVFELSKAEGDNFLTENDSYRLVISNKKTITITNTEVSDLSNEIKSLRSEFKDREFVFLKKVFDIISTYHPLLENLISLLSSLDIFSSFAYLILNSKFPYTKPIITEPRNKLEIKDSRHILLEYINIDHLVISNDISLTADSDNIHLLTGINMGGKSTFLRQIGICVILAHIGCYIPATYAKIPIIDQIFTRVGAGDLMLKGISTYMNEMIEVCSLIKSASDKSLLLIDELGRGTSTDDGVGISCAILYHISQVIKSYCLFATHFYELTEMENLLSNIKNFYMGYNVVFGQVVMDYKVLPGKNNSSFGVGMFKSLDFDAETCSLLDKFIKEEEIIEERENKTQKSN